MYVGQFQHGEKHGLGMSIWPWGNIYVGHFKKSDMNGQGTLTKPDGTTCADPPHRSGYQVTSKWRDQRRFSDLDIVS
ncbi:MAG: hypothetical protein JXR96_04475, partial [Deltaproteobacteria bacterium]|nr:hypothetical protein [Deltaproteobacteria bacterium]